MKNLLPIDSKIELNKNEFILRTPIDYLAQLYFQHKDINVAASRLITFLNSNINNSPNYLIFDKELPDIFNRMDSLPFTAVELIDKLYLAFNFVTLTDEIESQFSKKLNTTFVYNNKTVCLTTLFDHIGRQIRSKKTFYETPLLNALSKVIINKDREFAIDVGANIGNHTVFFGLFYNKIIAIEPLGVNFNCLQANIINNNLQEKVHSINNALSLDGRKMEPIAPTWNRGMCDMVSNNNATETITIDQLSPIIGPQKVSLVKIDCEAMSMEVFNALLPIIKKDKPVIVIEGTDQDINQITTNIKYEISGKFNATPTYILVPK